MNDLYKEIIFRDGIELTNGVKELTEKFLGNMGYICELGQRFSLSLDKFEVDSEFVVFEWRGSKINMLRFYTYYSKNMTSESPEDREKALQTILKK